MGQPVVEYFIVGARPVKLVPTDQGGLGVYAFNWQTGEFDLAMEYLSRLCFGKGDLDRVTQTEFDQRVEELRASLASRR
ncbi:MAG: hypothetical protein AB1938_13375 [Myxococcota bacterium]